MATMVPKGGGGAQPVPAAKGSQETSPNGSSKQDASPMGSAKARSSNSSKPRERLSRRKLEASASAPKGAGVWRLRLHEILVSATCDVCITVLILCNLMSVVLETNLAADGDPDTQLPLWMQVFDIVIMCAYAVELSLRLICYRAEFFKNAMNVWDFTVIGLDLLFFFIQLVWASVPFPIELLRISRAIKITRAARIMALMPELHMMIKGLVFAMRAIAAGVLMLIIALAFWGIMAVIFIHPLNKELTAEGYWETVDCERCPRAFESVQQAMLSLTASNLAGDLWGLMAVPITEMQPLAGVLFFFPALITTNLAVMNLILAVIVDKANEIREHMLALKVQQKEDEFAEATQRMYKIFISLDEDNDGYLTYEELHSGFHNDSVFSGLLRVMDIQEQDLEVVFNILDTDGSGRVEYREFVEQLYMMNKQSSQTMLVLIKFYIMELRKHFLEQPQATHSHHSFHEAHSSHSGSRQGTQGELNHSSSSLSGSGQKKPHGALSMGRRAPSALQLPVVIEQKAEDVQGTPLLAGGVSGSGQLLRPPSSLDSAPKHEAAADVGATVQCQAGVDGDPLEEMLSAMRLLQQRLEMHHDRLVASLQGGVGPADWRRSRPPSAQPSEPLFASGSNDAVPPLPAAWPAAPPDLGPTAMPTSTHTRLHDLRAEWRQDVAREGSCASNAVFGPAAVSHAHSIVGTRSSTAGVHHDSSYALQLLQ